MGLISCCVFWEPEEASTWRVLYRIPSALSAVLQPAGPRVGRAREVPAEKPMWAGLNIGSRCWRLLVQCFGCYLKKLIYSDIHAVSILETNSCLSDALEEDFFCSRYVSGWLCDHWISLKFCRWKKVVPFVSH